MNLSSAANWTLSKKTFAGGDGNNLAELPVGEQTLGGVRFRIADPFIQLRSKHLPELPAKVERIPIGRKLTRLAKRWSLTPSQSSSHVSLPGAAGSTTFTSCPRLTRARGVRENDPAPIPVPMLQNDGCA